VQGRLSLCVARARLVAQDVVLVFALSADVQVGALGDSEELSHERDVTSSVLLLGLFGHHTKVSLDNFMFLKLEAGSIQLKDRHYFLTLQNTVF